MPQAAISETFQQARMPDALRDALHRVAARNDRSPSDELRRALALWTVLAAVAVHVEDDARALGPEHLHEMTARLRAAASEQLGDAFPRAEPEALLAALAPPPADPLHGIATRSQRKTSDPLRDLAKPKTSDAA